jgi:hypothetical protein
MRKHLLAFLFLAMPCLAAAQTLPPRTPGLWQSTTNVTGADKQPIPNGSNIVTVSCVDPATDLKFFITGESQCRNLAITGGGTIWQIDGACQHDGSAVRIHETLVYASSQSVTLTALVDSSAGPLNIASQLTYQGACPPGMVPGDEGSLVNGAFSKADNINDPANQ